MDDRWILTDHCFDQVPGNFLIQYKATFEVVREDMMEDVIEEIDYIREQLREMDTDFVRFVELARED